MISRSRSRNWLVVVAFVISCTASAAGEDIYVDSAVCPAEGQGTVAQPYCRLQVALYAAGDGDTIHLAHGEYMQNVSFLGQAVHVLGDPLSPESVVLRAPTPHRVVDFANAEGPDTILEGVTITGGRGGIRCFESRPTIRNCEIGENTADTGAGIDCRSASPTIENCRIHDNRAKTFGGGINCAEGSAPLIRDCILIHNHAGSSGGGISCSGASRPTLLRTWIWENSADSRGGGIATHNGSMPTLDRCTVFGNTSREGAGLDCHSSSPILRNSTIQANIASASAGGINCSKDASPWIANCTINDNRAKFFNGGGIVCAARSHPTIADCTISGNSAVNGGGLYIFDQSEPYLHRCRVEGNRATGFGGGVACSGGAPRIHDCVFDDNEADAAGGIGCGEGCDARITNTTLRYNRGLQIAGGLLSNASRPLVVNGLIHDNEAGYAGGGVYNYNGGNPTLVNSSIIFNLADVGAGVFAGMNSHPTIVNSIIWRVASGVVDLDGTSTVEINYSILQGGWPAGIGNSLIWPEFETGDEPRLRGGSNAIDAGSNPAVPPGITRDITGAPRFFDDSMTPDTGVGPPPLVDIGPYEYRDCNGNGVEDATDTGDCNGDPSCTDHNHNRVPDVCETLGDLDLDGDVDAADAKLLFGCLAGPAGERPPPLCETFDFRTGDWNGDAHLDLRDVALFQIEFDGP